MHISSPVFAENFKIFHQWKKITLAFYFKSSKIDAMSKAELLFLLWC